MSISNKEKFTIKAKVKHGDLYDYSFVEYKTQYHKVKIICDIHGEFEQTPKAHLKGNGCLLCGREKMKKKLTKNIEEFILESKKIHKNKFNYSHTNYISAHIKTKISCPIHGEFDQTPANHLKGHGCPNCTYNNSNNDLFISMANIIHNYKYDYSLVNYLTNKKK